MAGKKATRYTSLPKGSGVLGPELKKKPLNWDVGLTIASVATLPLGGPAVAAGLRGALGASKVGARVLASPGSKYLASQVAAGVPKSRVLAGMTRNTARGLATRGGGAAAKTAKTTKAAAPKGNQYPNLPRTGRKTATGKPYTTAEMRTVAAASKGNYRLAAGAAAVGGVLALGKIPVSSSSTYARTGPNGSYVGSTVGGNRGSRPRPTATEGPKRSIPVTKRTTPSQPSGGGAGNARRPKGQGTGMSRRTALVKERLRLAEEQAKAGNAQAAAVYAQKALDIQKKGKGTAASMKRVSKVASAYGKAAGVQRRAVKEKEF